MAMMVVAVMLHNCAVMSIWVISLVITVSNFRCSVCIVTSIKVYFRVSIGWSVNFSMVITMNWIRIVTIVTMMIAIPSN